MLTAIRGQSLRLLRNLRVLNRKDAVTVTWLSCAAVLPFVHLRFDDKVIDPFITVSVPMRTDTFVWMLCSGLGSICFSVFAYRAAIFRLKVFALLWMVYCVVDLLLFIWCYNQKDYYYIPYVVMLLIAVKLVNKDK